MEPQNQGDIISSQHNQPTSSSKHPIANQPIGPEQSEQASPQPNTPNERKSKKLLIGIICAIIGVFMLVAIIMFVVISNSSKMSCSGTHLSDFNVDITLYYNDKELVGYSAVNMEYDFDEQKSYAKAIGIQEYLREFRTMFERQFSGQCKLSPNN